MAPQSGPHKRNEHWPAEGHVQRSSAAGSGRPSSQAGGPSPRARRGSTECRTSCPAAPRGGHHRLPRVRHPGPRLPEAALRRRRARLAAVLQLQAPRVVPLVQHQAPAADRGSSGGSRHPAGAGAAMGAVATDPAARAARRATRSGHASSALPWIDGSRDDRGQAEDPVDGSASPDMRRPAAHTAWLMCQGASPRDIRSCARVDDGWGTQRIGCRFQRNQACAVLATAPRGGRRCAEKRGEREPRHRRGASPGGRQASADRSLPQATPVLGKLQLPGRALKRSHLKFLAPTTRPFIFALSISAAIGDANERRAIPDLPGTWRTFLVQVLP